MPPKQGRGYNSKKASAQGVQKRMSNRDLDQEGWVQVRIERSSPVCCLSVYLSAEFKGMWNDKPLGGAGCREG